MATQFEFDFALMAGASHISTAVANAPQGNAQGVLNVSIDGTNHAPAASVADAGSVTEGGPQSFIVDGNDVIANGSFELGLDNWNIGGAGGSTSMISFPHTGSQALFAMSMANGVISQDVRTVAGQEYQLDFWVTDIGVGGTSFSANWNGETLVSVADGYLPGFTEYKVDVVGAADSSRLEFDVGNCVFFILDDVSVIEGRMRQSASGTFAFSDVDLSDTHSIDAQARGADYLGSFDAQLLQDSTGSGSGSIGTRFLVGNSAIEYLAQGQTLTQTYDVTIDDGHAGGSVTQAVTVNLVGINDASVITNWDATGEIREDAAVNNGAGEMVAPAVEIAGGSMYFSDVDLIDTHSVAVAAADSGYVGSLQGVVTGDSTGTGFGSVGWKFAVDNSAIDFLAEGQLLRQTYNVSVDDGHAGGSATQAVTVDIWGANDAPIARNDTGAAVEDGGPATLSGMLLLANDSDVDAGDGRTITAVTNSAAGALVNQVGGNVVYDIGTAFQTLQQGATSTDSFTYTMADGAGATSSATVTMTVTGVNDAPVLANPIADQNIAAGSPFNFSLAANSFTDIDAGDSLAYAATLADGSALPSWLSFDAATGTFTGTPPGGTATGGGTGTVTGAASSLQLRVNATDTAGASAFGVFALNIAAGSGGTAGGSGDDESSDSGHDDGHSPHQDSGGSGNEDGRNDGDRHGGDRNNCDHNDGGRNGGDRHDGSRLDDKSQYYDERNAIAARLEKNPDYDFSFLSNYLAQDQGGGYGALTAAQVAQQWRSVQNRVGQIAQDDEDARHGAQGGEHYGCDDGFAQGATYVGYAGSTGQGASQGGMASFSGLGEGFRKLG